jgi:hypothetical protein
MHKADWTLKAILMTIALFLGLVALRPFFTPVNALAQTARFEHVLVLAPLFLYKGQQGFLVMDQRNANIWFIPKLNEQYQTPVFVVRLPFDKLDHAPQ